MKTFKIKFTEIDTVKTVSVSREESFEALMSRHREACSVKADELFAEGYEAHEFRIGPAIVVDWLTTIPNFLTSHVLVVDKSANASWYLESADDERSQ